jgi:hypothetical protein
VRAIIAPFARFSRVYIFQPDEFFDIVRSAWPAFVSWRQRCKKSCCAADQRGVTRFKIWPPRMWMHRRRLTRVAMVQ